VPRDRQRQGQGTGDLHGVRRARTGAVPAGVLLRGQDLRAMHGRGRRSATHARCRGEGLQAKKHEILVKVPAGVEQDTRIRYQGEGEGGRFGGPAGDLYVVLNVKAHKFFERDGDDLHCVLPVSFPQAALGTELQIETLEGQRRSGFPRERRAGASSSCEARACRTELTRKGDLIVEVRWRRHPS